VVRGQYESLSRFHAKLNGAAVNGWTVHAPSPLYLCERPLALVMTMVPGRSLASCLESAGLVTAEALDSIAGAVVAAMERYWSIDSQIHGDLNFDNILCDAGARNLSFVDPGVIEKEMLCAGVGRRWYPASRDLAYLLYDTGVTVRRTFGNPGARRRQEDLIERVLRAFQENIGPGAETHGLLDEIEACVQVHLNGLPASWSMRGLWHVVLRRIASRRIAEILGRLRTGLAPVPAAKSLAGRGVEGRA
jgi:tRNA A-37 threonylcarbamoyl transferase component Bud32